MGFEESANGERDLHSSSNSKRRLSSEVKENGVPERKKTKNDEKLQKGKNNEVMKKNGNNAVNKNTTGKVESNGKVTNTGVKADDSRHDEIKTSSLPDVFDKVCLTKVISTSGTQEFLDVVTTGIDRASSKSNVNAKNVKGSKMKTHPTSPESSSNSATIDVAELFQKLGPINEKLEKPLAPLSNSEIDELESVFEFSESGASDAESGWRNDWGGNLAYIDKEICNPLFRVKSQRCKQSKSGTGVGGGVRGKKANEKLTILQWATLIEENGAAVAKANAVRRMVKLLLRHVCTHAVDPSPPSNAVIGSQVVHKRNAIPQSTIRLLSSLAVDTDPLTEIEEGIRRASYDPEILKEDGWIVERSEEAQGATGGPCRIGDKIRYEGSDGVVIAYIHDADIGDLWKAIWLEDYIAFDLEAEELLQAKQKWEKIHWRKSHDAKVFASLPFGKNRKINVREAAIGSGGFVDFTVKGIEFGIVLASSYSKGARPGVYWPARVMHASEALQNGKRNTSKAQKKLDVVFLAPYWNSADDTSYAANKIRAGPSLSENEESFFTSSPLFQLEMVEANDETIQQYPFEHDDSTSAVLDMDQLLMSFRFTGLPKSAFLRYVDACRLASCLKEYARTNLNFEKAMSESSASLRATAALFDTHPLAVQVPLFPSVILHLPFVFILQQLPKPKMLESDSGQRDNTSNKEPVLQLETILDSMKPPRCWGSVSEPSSHVRNGKTTRHDNATKLEPSGDWLKSSSQNETSDHMSLLSRFVVDFPLLSVTFDRYRHIPEMEEILYRIHLLVRSNLENTKTQTIEKQDSVTRNLKSIITRWSSIKRTMDDTLAALPMEDEKLKKQTIVQWRQGAERLYRYIIKQAKDDPKIEHNKSFATLVITDSRCNEHRTSDQCLERRVRLPAALKAAKKAGANEKDGPIRLVHTIDDSYIEYLEEHILPIAHTKSYLKRMKGRCSTAKTSSEVLIFTEDSDGNGGDDTRGSQGSWMAALCGVAAAVTACDKVVRGECVNAFCVTRPPGHHAGRSLHPMKAISNGFCLLNPVACAAIHATAPVSLGGLGLSRVCVLDFDVHHGNGTQDILASTYDPRYLYISIHAGGAHINGIPNSDDPSDEPFGLTKNPNMVGIYPGRCGDTSPHAGVVNIPLGSKVLSHGVGTALLQRVTPAVEAFTPDLILLSAGFDAHKNDPMGLGGLSAEDFGNITDVACQLALKYCSGRVVSVLEGGYGVPCCRPQQNTFLPTSLLASCATLPTSCAVFEDIALSHARDTEPTGPSIAKETNAISESISSSDGNITTSIVTSISPENSEKAAAAALPDISDVTKIDITAENPIVPLPANSNADAVAATIPDSTATALSIISTVPNADAVAVTVSAPSAMPDTTAIAAIILPTTTVVQPPTQQHDQNQKQQSTSPTNNGTTTTTLSSSTTTTTNTTGTGTGTQSQKIRPQPSRLLDLSDTIPDNMDDQVPYPLQVRLEKCHTEGFIDCVYEHVLSLARCTDR